MSLFISQTPKFTHPLIEQYVNGDHHIYFLRNQQTGGMEIVVHEDETSNIIDVTESKGADLKDITNKSDLELKKFLLDHWITVEKSRSFFCCNKHYFFNIRERQDKRNSQNRLSTSSTIISALTISDLTEPFNFSYEDRRNSGDSSHRSSANSSPHMGQRTISILVQPRNETKE